MATPPTMTPDDVATALHLSSAKALWRRRARLEGAGFPKMLPELPPQWSRVQVTAWIDTGGRTHTPEAETTEAEIIDRERSRMEGAIGR